MQRLGYQGIADPFNRDLVGNPLPVPVDPAGWPPSGRWTYSIVRGMLDQDRLRRDHFDGFGDCYLPSRDRAERVESERWKSYTHEKLLACDKVNLGLT